MLYEGWFVESRSVVGSIFVSTTSSYTPITEYLFRQRLKSTTPPRLDSRTFCRLGVGGFAFWPRTFVGMAASSFTRSKSVSISWLQNYLFCWYLILRSHEEFLYCNVKKFSSA